MYVKRNIDTVIILRYAWPVLLGTTIWSLAVLIPYYFFGIEWIKVPFQPISVIGIAASFFIGFKNNQSYDRFWEGRKIWGGIVNYSRTWANQVVNLIEADESSSCHKDLVYRHIAWLHALRLQLRQKTPFSPKDNSVVEEWLHTHDENEKICEIIKPYLSEKDHEDVKSRKNIATHLVKLQAKQIAKLSENNKIDGFEKIILMKCLEEFYNLQGKCERIKNTPFPRQYAYFSKVFAYIFVFLLPMGLISVFSQMFASDPNLPSLYLFLLIPLSVLTSWIFLTWEIIGDNSEDPFEGRTNDVPMTALTRTIEIDLRDILNEKSLPEKLQPKDNILY